jgi:hypothetical protein
MERYVGGIRPSWRGWKLDRVRSTLVPVVDERGVVAMEDGEVGGWCWVETRSKDGRSKHACNQRRMGTLRGEQTSRLRSPPY